MRKFYVLLLFCFFSFAVYSQPYGNEWINYGQQYYKFPVTASGIYRISQATLLNAGVPLGLLDPRNIQVFGRGKELALYVQGEGDGVFDNTDFIEFYAQRNDAWLDSAVFDTPNNLVNPYYSLYNDTAYYFLTWNNSQSNKRMILENDVATGLYASQSYFFKESLSYHGDEYLNGVHTPAGTYDPEHSEAEGWAGYSFAFNTTRSENLSTRNVYTGGPNAIFRSHVISSSNDYFVNGDNHLKLTLSPANVVLFDTVFEGYSALRLNASFSASNLVSNASSFDYSDLFIPGVTNPGTLSIAFSYLKYPHTFDLENQTEFKLFIPDVNLQARSQLDIINFSAASPIHFYDLNNNKRCNVAQNGAVYNLNIANTGNEKECFITSDNQVQWIAQLKKAGVNGVLTNFPILGQLTDYVIITNKKLMSEANQYANYRTGKGYSVLVIDVDELYEQFSYGIPKDPLAIRHFSEMALDIWPGKPKHMFLIGKGISHDLMRQNLSNYDECLVPTMGYPPSDVLMVTRFNGALYEPLIPLGRLAAKNGTQVLDYLTKVSEYEGLHDETYRLNMKNVLHFGGGTDINQQNLFKSYLNIYKSTLKDTLYGANVFTFLKTTAAPIQITASDSVRNLINNGVSIMTFFGHASGSGFDQNIDEASTYTNDQGRYPLLVANACFVGNIHLPDGLGQSTSENYTLIAQRGAIAFLAQTGGGLDNLLFQYTNELFRNMGSLNYGKSIGSSIQKTIQTIQAPGVNYLKEVCLEMTLHGDPALVINSYPLPDYMLSQPNVYYTPQTITANIDSFDVHVIVTNEAKAINDSIVIELRRTLPDGTVMTYGKVIQGVHYSDTIVFRLPVDHLKGVGFNNFTITADALFKVTELTEMNNVINTTLFIASSEITPVYPYEYAIYPQSTVVLKASTGDPFAPAKNYRFELDTTDLFNSPFKRTQIVNHIGGVVTWTPPVTLQDSIVYFWRVSRDSVDATGYLWRESSFQHIKGVSGWSQSHFFQFKKDDFVFIDHNRPQRKFNFVINKKLLTARTFNNPYNQSDLFATEYKLDSDLQDYGGCSYIPAIHVAVIDSLSLTPWGTFWTDPFGVQYNPSHSYNNANDNHNCQDNVDKFFIFRTNDATQMEGLDTLLHRVPKGDYIIAWTWIQGNFQNWANNTAMATFQGMGADTISVLPDTSAWLFFVKKGYNGTKTELFSRIRNTELKLSQTLVNNWTFGEINTPLIGPSAKWDSLHWRQFALENPTYDTMRLKITGVKITGEENVLFSNIQPAQGEMSIAGISASTYPFLKLDAFTKDDSAYTSAQLKRWQITYQEVPEAAVNPIQGFYLNSNTLTEGEDLQFKVAIENISDHPMDSLLVKYWMEDKNRVLHQVALTRNDSLRVGQNILTSVSLPTLGYSGSNTLWMEANPALLPGKLYDQAEQYHFNNYAAIKFTASGDRANPLLDVTFDGVHILDGDIVSAKPSILVQLNDENKYLALSDTSYFQVYIKPPGSQVSQRIYFRKSGVEQLIFTPASLPNNKAKIVYNAVFPADGKYELLVQAQDASKNKAGNIDYRVNFEVINRSTITEVMNYPNPFTTSTRFVFTLTGSEIPTYFKIQIMTITGKVVREITQDQMGMLHIGRNITEYAWDGTDEFGDRLANGVYLYKVTTEINNETIEHRETGADQYFTKGFGKMFLMR
jgi:hypothetical protein